MVVIIFSIILCDGNIIKGITSFIYSYVIICYGVHLCAHIDFLYCTPQSIIHCKHHENSESMLYFVLECIIEYFGFAANIVFKYLLFESGIINIYFIDTWNVIFMYLVYTTVHNFNYGYLKINNYHAKHHENVYTNIGPDICDLIFNTKNNETPENELVDHYIPNIIFAFIVVAALKYFYNEKVYKSLFIGSYVILVMVIIISCILILNHQIDTSINAELARFKRGVHF